MGDQSTRGPAPGEGRVRRVHRHQPSSFAASFTCVVDEGTVLDHVHPGILMVVATLIFFSARR
jgi:hypothetical protein